MLNTFRFLTLLPPDQNACQMTIIKRRFQRRMDITNLTFGLKNVPATFQRIIMIYINVYLTQTRNFGITMRTTVYQNKYTYE